MFSTNGFAFVNMLGKGADASFERQQVLAHNIANVNTPNYKRSELTFEKIFERELRQTRAKDVAGAIRNVDLSDLKGEVYEDMSNFSYRIDRNNVDIDTENVEIASEQLRYQTITTMISNSIARFKVVAGS